VASPLVATYLGLEDASAFDVVVVEPPRTQGSAAPDSAVLFLHGYAGGFDLPCWQVASAVARSGAVTACPSTRWVGDWWSPEGEAIVRRTVDMLRARGVARIVLAGLSNGGYGASRIAPRMKGVFAGLVLVSGAAADAPPAGIPTLLLHGTHDTVTSFESSRRYAARTGATLVSLDAGHFAMLVRAEEANRALGDFVAARVGVVARGGDGLSTRRGSAEGSSATPSRRPRLCRRADR
jgi:pimeloyl-ACP methyl ester carboxylesterase